MPLDVGDDAHASARVLALQEDCVGGPAVEEMRDHVQAAARDRRRHLVVAAHGRDLGGGAVAALVAACSTFDAVILCELSGTMKDRLRQVDPKGAIQIHATRAEALASLTPTVILGRTVSMVPLGHALTLAGLLGATGRETARAVSAPSTPALTAIRDLLAAK
jgi:hypothetical protein